MPEVLPGVAANGSLHAILARPEDSAVRDRDNRGHRPCATPVDTEPGFLRSDVGTERLATRMYLEHRVDDEVRRPEVRGGPLRRTSDAPH